MVLEQISIFLFAQRVLLALAVGALIGLEREYTKKQEVAGLRTFALVSFLGAISAYMSILTGSTLFLLVSYLGVIGLVFIQVIKPVERTWNAGLTTLFAFLITFFSGALVFYSLEIEAVLVSIVITLILFERVKLHRFVRDLKQIEITEALEFLIVSFILFTFIPEQPIVYGPLVFPLKQFFSFVFFVSVVSFIGYVLSRTLTADKSLVAIGLASGLISLSAFSVKMREMVAKRKEVKKGIRYAILGAYSTFCLRNLLLTGFFSLALFNVVLPSLLSMSLLMTLGLIHVYTAHKHLHQHKIKFENPFSVSYAVKIGAIFAASLLVANVVFNVFGETAFVVTTILLSFISSSGAVSAVAFQAQTGSIDIALASQLIIIATTIDMIVKNLISYRGKMDRKTIAYLILVGLYGSLFVFWKPV